MGASATELIEQFVVEATRMGSVVYRATDPEDVITYILDIARERNMRSVVKSKSSLANRIGLRQSLQNKGLDVKETDIGEWIAQLSGESPADDRKPVAQKSVNQIAKVLSEATARELNPDPELLLEATRLTLRESYINADIGISEAEIAIAETGTYVMASDEGNDRLAALLPRLHVTLIDERNMVATWDEAITRLKELYKDKKEWRMPSFITYVTGRNTTGDIPGALMARAQGPEEEHIVLVDMS
jgi:L-lactate utilization protein LutB